MSLIESNKYLRDPEYRKAIIRANAYASSVFEGARLPAHDAEDYRALVSDSSPKRKASAKKRSRGA